MRAPVCAICRWIARATSSRGRELVDEPLAGVVEQHRALAADRLGDEEPVGAVGRRDGGRMELQHLEVRERRAGAVGEQQAPPVAPGGFVVRAHSAAAPPVASTTARRRELVAAVEPHARGSARRRSGSRSPAGPRAPRSGVLGDERGQLADQPPAGRGAAGVDDPARRVAALEPEREPP